MILRARGFAFLLDDSGSELAEYALVLSAFTVIAVLAVRVLGTTGNAQVESDENSYTNAFVTGY
jgi:Flp pilus assembly pilin Flp